jgi:hypothetical protein
MCCHSRFRLLLKFHLALSCLVVSCIILCGLVLCCLELSSRVVSCLVLSCAASFHLVSCLADVMTALDEHGYAIVEGRCLIVLVLSYRPCLAFLCPSPSASPSP